MLDSHGSGKKNPSSFEPVTVVVTLLVFLILLIIWVQVNLWYEQDLYSHLRSAEETKLVLQTNSLSMGINKRILILESLSSFTKIHNSCESIDKHFFGYIAELYASTGGIRNFAIAPGGVQQYVYPEEEGVNVVGHDLINDSRENVRKDVDLTIESRSIVLSGPYELRQGGLGLVARKAVFIDGEFFGLTSMVIDMPVVFAESGIDINNNTFALRINNETILGDSDIFQQEPVIQKIEVYNEQWEIASIPETGWKEAVSKEAYVFKVITLLPVFLLTVMTYLALVHKEELELSVLQRTKELKMEKELTQKYLDDSGVMFILVNPAGNVILVNSKVKEILGFDNEELIATDWLDNLIPESELPGMKKLFKELVEQKGEESHYYECTTNTKNSELKLVMWHVSSIKDENGVIAGILAAGMDITESRKTENALKTYAEELSIKNEELKSLHMLKNEFISNITHELRTPMNSIKGFAEVLCSEDLGAINAEQKKALGRILSSSFKLEKLIDSLLYMAHSKKETMELTFSRFDVGELLNAIFGRIMQDAMSKKITLVMDIDPQLPSICGNEEHLGKVFWNLLNNAIKFTPAGGEVKLSASKLNDSIHLLVSDNGIGIPDEQMNSVFDDFYQVDGSPTRKYSGTGIGLFISKKIIATHGGEIWLESEKDEGTTVHVILPLDCTKPG